MHDGTEQQRGGPPTTAAPPGPGAPPAHTAWQRLWARVAAVTPSQLARAALALGALGLVGWQIWLNRVVLSPFFAGLALAYVTAPLVNGLDRALPRWLAVLLVIVGELLLLVAATGLLAPPLVAQLADLVARLPSREELRGLIERLLGYFQGLPEPTREAIREGLRPTLEQLRVNLLAYLRSLLDLTVASLFGLANAFGLILSFLILPTWIFAVLHDQQDGLQAIDRRLAPGARKDFWAVAQIVDRPLRAFLGGQVVMGLAVGALNFLGLRLLERLGLASFEFELLLALSAGLLELVPAVGPILYAVVALVAGLTVSPELAGTLLLVAIGAQVVANQLVLPRVERRYASSIHPVLLAVAVVMVSQLGLLWLLIAGPLAAIVVDLFRYLYGRVGDPPRPAGLLPGEPQPAAARTAATAGRRRRPQARPRAGPTSDKPM